MTSYDGKCLSFDSSKEPVNRETHGPSHSYQIEKLYAIHRQQILTVQPVVDTSLVIPEFFKNNTGVKLKYRREIDKLIKINENIHERITKIQNNESMISRRIGDWPEKFASEKVHMKRLKSSTRLRKVIEIERENEYFFGRLSRVKPMISSSEMKTWYSKQIRPHHSDPTAGHIFRSIEPRLLPKLPPLTAPTSTPQLKKSASTPSTLKRQNTGHSEDSDIDLEQFLSESPPTKTITKQPSRTRKSSGLPSKPKKKPEAKRESDDDNGEEEDELLPLNVEAAESKQEVPALHRKAKREMSLLDDVLTLHSSLGLKVPSGQGQMVVVSDDSKFSKKKGKKRGGGKAMTFDPPSRPSEGFEDFDNEDDESVDYDEDDEDCVHSITSEISDTDSHVSQLDTPTPLDPQDKGNDLFVILLSRPIPVPTTSKNCLVQICSPVVYDEHLLLRVCSSLPPYQLYSEKKLSIDQTYEIINDVYSNSASLMRAADSESIHTLKALLVSMFKEADSDENGYLTFDEFQELMERVDLGISSEELRFVISEADENENGVVDYYEFIPLAVDLIQSFRARNKAKMLANHLSSKMDEVVKQALPKDELDKISSVCLGKIYEIDSKRIGVIRVSDLKRCLIAASFIGLTDTEVSMICQRLPRDTFGRIVYANSFLEVLSSVRFATMKNTLIEAQASDLQKYLLEICKDCESKLHMAAVESSGHSISGSNSFQSNNTNSFGSGSGSGSGEASGSSSLSGFESEYSATGFLPFRALMNLLISNPRISLSRLRVMVIMSEAVVLDGLVNYFEFIPVVAKTIEIMFEPKAIKQRTQLIETANFSPESLLQTLHTEFFQKHLKEVFQKYDSDQSGSLDLHEFTRCMEALDLFLEPDEIASLIQSTLNHSASSHFTFAQFNDFFVKNLVDLEEQRHIKLVQEAAAMAKHAEIDDKLEEFNTLDSEYASYLLDLFKLADRNQSGFLEYDEFVQLLKTLEISVSPYEMEVILDEVDLNRDGKISYSEFAPVCARLLKSFKSHEANPDERNGRELWASLKADKYLSHCSSEISETVKYISDHMRFVYDTVHDDARRFSSMQSALHEIDTGLNRNEANAVLRNLFMKCNVGTVHAAVDTAPSSPVPGDSRPFTSNSSYGDEENYSLDGDEEKHSPNSPSPTDPLDNVPIIMLSRRNSKLAENQLVPLIHKEDVLSSAKYKFSPLEPLDPAQGIGEPSHPHLLNPSTADLIDPRPTLKSRRSSGQRTPEQEYEQEFEDSDSVSDPSNINAFLIPRGDKEVNEALFFHQLKEIAELKKESKCQAPVPQIVFQVNLTTRDLTNLVLEARKSTIMRNLLEPSNHESLHHLLVRQFEREYNRMKSEDNYVPISEGLMPVKDVYRILEHCPDVRLARIQLISMISWAECFDRSGLYLDFRIFAEHAAHVIHYLSEAEFLDAKMDVMDKSARDFNDLDDRFVFGGLSVRELDKHYNSYFTRHDHQTGEVMVREAIDAVQTIPKLHLSVHDAVAIVSAYHSSFQSQNISKALNSGSGGIANTNHITWRHFARWSQWVLRAHCRERMISRRILLMTASSTDGTMTGAALNLGSSSDRATLSVCSGPLSIASQASLDFDSVTGKNIGVDLKTPLTPGITGSSYGFEAAAHSGHARLQEDSFMKLKSIATKLIDYVKVKVQNEIVVAILPSEVQHKSSLMAHRKDPKKSHQFLEGDHLQSLSVLTCEGQPSHILNLNNCELTRLFKGAVQIPMFSSDFVKHSRTINHDFSMPDVSKLGSRSESQVMLPVLLRVLAVDINHALGDVELIATLTSPSSQFHLCLELPLRLPSVALVDLEMASQFGRNLVEKLFFEFGPSHSSNSTSHASSPIRPSFTSSPKMIEFKKSSNLLSPISTSLSNLSLAPSSTHSSEELLLSGSFHLCLFDE